MNVRKKIIPIVIFISIITLICLFAPVLNPAINSLLLNCDVISAKDSLIVHYVSVGQGDAMAINLPDGKIMLIDMGTVEHSVTFTNYIDDYVLSRNHDKVLDYVVLTHADNDHTGGALRILQNYSIGTLYIPNIDGEASEYYNAKDYWESKSINTQYHTDGTVIKNNDYKIEFFGPLSEDNTNDNCPIIKISYLGYSFLFTGDISSEVEEEFITTYGNILDCDVLKVAHHGSKYSTSINFLNTVTPSYAVISCGVNSYGHPTDTVLNNLDAVDSSVLRTDLDGNIAFVVNDYGLNYLTNEYLITNIVDYRVYLFVLDLVLIGNLIIVIIKHKNKDKTTHKP